VFSNHVTVLAGKGLRKLQTGNSRKKKYLNGV
jgi:hypothetical protein